MTWADPEPMATAICRGSRFAGSCPSMAQPLVAPPFYYLVKGSFLVPLPGFRTEWGLGNYARVIALDDFRLWRTTLAFAPASGLTRSAITNANASGW